MVALFEATGGTDWRPNTNWLADAPKGTWSGTTTNEEGRVTDIELYSNSLEGFIAFEHGYLTKLMSFFIAQSKLSGYMPGSPHNVVESDSDIR